LPCLLFPGIVLRVEVGDFFRRWTGINIHQATLSALDNCVFTRQRSETISLRKQDFCVVSITDKTI